MKMNCFAGTTTILLLVMAGAAAQQKAPTPPPKAAKLIAQWGKETVADYCSGGNLRPKGPATKIVFRADLNRDGFIDYVITRGFECQMDGEVFHSAFSPSAPWALVESTSVENGRVGAEGSSWQITPFSNTDEVEAPKLQQLDGRPALILVNGGPGMNNPPYYSFAWVGIGSGDEHAVAWFDRNGKRINKDGSAFGVAKVPPVPPLGIAPGYYVVEREDCRSGRSFFFYDGKRFGQYGNTPAKGDIQPVAKLKKNGKHWVNESDDLITALGTARVSWEDSYHGEFGPFRWCPIDQVPARARVK